MVMLTAIGVKHTERRRRQTDGKLSDGSKGVTNSDAKKKKKKKSLAKTQEKNRSKNIFPQRRKGQRVRFGWCILGGCLLVLPGKSGS